MTQTSDPTKSILDSTKKMLGIAPDYDVFDPDIIMHINSVFVTLNQLGIGPNEGFSIEDSSKEWDAFLGSDPLLNNVKSYVYIKVRMIFDPPATGFTQQSMQQMAQELEFRMSVNRENKDWVDPNLPVIPPPP